MTKSFYLSREFAVGRTDLAVLTVVVVGVRVSIACVHIWPRLFSRPSHSLVVFPDAFSGTSIDIYDLAFAVSLAVDPLAVVAASICPGVLSYSMFFVEPVFSIVSSSVLPLIFPISMHLVVEPIPFIPAPIWPHINSFPCDFVVHPISIVVTSIFPDVFAFSMLLPHVIVPFIATPVHPGFKSEAMLEIVKPFAFVSCSIVMEISSFPWSFIIFPLPIINVSVDVNEFSFPIGFVSGPISFVAGSIRPDLNSIPFAKISPPTALIDNSIGEPDRRPCLNIGVLTTGSFRVDVIEIGFIFFGHTGPATDRIVFTWHWKFWLGWACLFNDSEVELLLDLHSCRTCYNRFPLAWSNC